MSRKDDGFPTATEIRAAARRRSKLPLTPAERQAIRRARPRDVESVLGLVMDLVEDIEVTVPESKAYEWILTNVVAALGTDARRDDVLRQLAEAEFPTTSVRDAIVREVRRLAVGKARWASRAGVFKRLEGPVPPEVVGRWIVKLEREGTVERSSDGDRVRIAPEKAR